MTKTNKLPDFLEELAQEMAEKERKIHVLNVNLEIMVEFLDSKGLGKEYLMYYNGSLRNRGIMDDHGNFISGNEKSSPN